MWLSCREWTLPVCVVASHANTRNVQPLPSGNHRPLAGFRHWCVNNFHRRSIPCDGKSQGRFPERWALGAGLWRGTDFNRPPHCRQRELRDKVLQAENSREAPNEVSAVRPRGVMHLDSLHEHGGSDPCLWSEGVESIFPKAFPALTFCGLSLNCGSKVRTQDLRWGQPLT